MRHDLSLSDQLLGQLDGIVRLNGEPASGMQVRLRRIADPSAVAEQGGGRGRGERDDPAAAVQRTLQAGVGADGRFSIRSIPPGEYNLDVERRRGRGGRGRGGRGGSRIHRELVRIAEGERAFATVEIATSSVDFQVAVEGAETPGRMRISVVLASEAAGAEPRAWRRLASYRTFGLRAGSTGPQDLEPGVYAYSISGRGVVEARGEIGVVLGRPLTVPVTLKPSEPQEGAAGAQGGNSQGGNSQGGRRR